MRPDHKAILNLVKPNSKVLDLGCGDGELIALLSSEKHVKVQGIEIDDKSIFECIAKGLSVYHGDIDTGLSEFRDKSFDYVIINQAIQQIQHIQKVLDEAARVGNKVIVGIPNFAYFKSRIQLFFFGKTPKTSYLPFKWFETPNIRCLSISDFKKYCKEKDFIIEKELYIGEKFKVRFLPNLVANVGIFVVSKKVSS